MQCEWLLRETRSNATRIHVHVGERAASNGILLGSRLTNVLARTGVQGVVRYFLVLSSLLATFRLRKAIARREHEPRGRTLKLVVATGTDREILLLPGHRVPIPSISPISSDNRRDCSRVLLDSVLQLQWPKMWCGFYPRVRCCYVLNDGSVAPGWIVTAFSWRISSSWSVGTWVQFHTLYTPSQRKRAGTRGPLFRESTHVMCSREKPPDNLYRFNFPAETIFNESCSEFILRWSVTLGLLAAGGTVRVSGFDLRNKRASRVRKAIF